MGLSASSWLLGLGLGLWLLGERVLSALPLRTGVGAVSALCFVSALILDARALRRAADDAACGPGYRLAAAALLAAAAALYAGAGWLGLDTLEPAHAALWLAPLVCGVTARLAADRAYRSGPHDAQRIATRGRAGLGFGIGLCLLAFVNYAAVTHDVRTDFSYQAVNEPSAQVRELVGQLKEPVTLRLFFEQGSEVVPALKPYFDALSRVSSRFTVRVEDAALSPELLRRHRVRGNGYGLLLAGAGARERGEAFHIGDDLRDARRVLKTLDAHVANHLSVLARPVRPVYLTIGHGERSVAGDVEEARGRYLRDFEQLLARFNVRTHRLSVNEGLGRAVPADAAAVLVLGAERPFLDAEAAALLDYAKRGGRVWLGLEPGVDTGLAELLELGGIAPVPLPVVCTESFVVRSRTAADRALIQTQRYAAHPTTQAARKSGDRPRLVFVRGAALTPVQGAFANAAVTAIQSERDCFIDANGDYVRGANEAAGSFPLLVAATLRGAGHAEGRLVVSGDGDLPTDQVLRNGANTLITLDVMRWLVGDEGMRAVATLPDDLPVLHQRTEDRAWFYLSAFGVPLPLFFVALLRFRRRQGRAANP